jgi:hypothetical protein
MLQLCALLAGHERCEAFREDTQHQLTTSRPQMLPVAAAGSARCLGVMRHALCAAADGTCSS